MKAWWRELREEVVVVEAIGSLFEREGERGDKK